MQYRIPWSGKAHNYSDSEIAAVVEVMKSGDPQTQGKYLSRFESDFSEFIGQKNCFAMTNCTHALELTVDLIGLKSGDEVILPAHTYCASAIPFGRKGARLVWADIEPDTFLVSPRSIEKCITQRTKAIVVVHLYGMMARIEEILSLAKRHGIPVVEDVAQAIGARHGGKRAGTFGDYGCFSFHGQKNVTTLGEGGMLTVKSDREAAMIPGLRHNGHRHFVAQKRYWQPAMVNVDMDLEGVWPHNFSLTEAQAALGSQLLKRADELNSERRTRALRFRAELRDFPELVFQKIEEADAHAHHLLPARYDGHPNGKQRDDLIQLLSEKYGVRAIVQYHPLYRYDLFKKTGNGTAECPNTDHYYDRMISFPFYHWMSNADFDYLIDSVQSALIELRKGAA